MLTQKFYVMRENQVNLKPRRARRYDVGDE